MCDKLIPDGLEEAIIGVTMYQPGRDLEVFVLDYQKCIDILVREGMDAQDADEYLQFNTVGAWMGQGTPMYIRALDDEEAVDISERIELRKGAAGDQVPGMTPKD